MRAIVARSLLLASALGAFAAPAARAAETPPAASDAAPAPDGATNAASPSPASPSPAVAPSPPPGGPLVLTAPPPAVVDPGAAMSFPPPPAPAAFQGPNASVRVGVLLQPQYQRLGETTFAGDGQNLYLRRARIIVGGTFFGVVDYFFDTDYPDLFIGKAASGTPTVKYTPTMLIQDAFATYHPFGSLIMLDAGYFLPPMGHNALQSAATLFGWDYFAYTFQHDQALGSVWSPIITPGGRDAGFELRGLLLGGHLEYRVGMFQGLRAAKTTSETSAENGFRFASRLQINFLDPEPGFFYAGTYLGAKRIVSIGASYDFQNSLTNDYLYFAADALVDLPVGPGVVTVQVDFAHWDGHMFTPMMLLQNQTAVMAEGGYTFFAARLSPILRFEHLEGPEIPPLNRYGGGLAFWPLGYYSNFKLFYTRITQAAPPPPAAPVHAANQINFQWQIYYF